MQVAVYGSLRKGHGNYEVHLKGKKCIGQFETEPIYNLIDLGGFPGLLKGGATSVIMEVYDINSTELAAMDGLEGYRGPEYIKSNMYNREKIESPYGQVSVYFFNSPYNEKHKLVESGDWTDYYKTKSVIM